MLKQALSSYPIFAGLLFTRACVLELSRCPSKGQWAISGRSVDDQWTADGGRRTARRLLLLH